MQNHNQIKMDERNVYSASGKAYARIPPRNRNHLRERRLPFIKRVKAKGSLYHYFVAPNGAARVRLPDPEQPHFDHAYLAELARLEGGDIEPYEHPVRSHVYFVGCEHAIKIGTAHSVETRLKAIQAHSPVSVRVLATTIGDMTMEREYHRRFAEHRLHGEWFAPHPDILAEIDRLTPPSTI